MKRMAIAVLAGASALAITACSSEPTAKLVGAQIQPVGNEGLQYFVVGLVSHDQIERRRTQSFSDGYLPTKGASEVPIQRIGHDVVRRPGDFRREQLNPRPLVGPNSLSPERHGAQH